MKLDSMTIISSNTCTKCINTYMMVQWNPSCEATPFASEEWPFKRVGLSSGVEINTFMFRFTLSSGLSKGVASHQGGLSKGVSLYTKIILTTKCHILNDFNSYLIFSSIKKKVTGISDSPLIMIYFCCTMPIRLTGVLCNTVQIMTIWQM